MHDAAGFNHIGAVGDRQLRVTPLELIDRLAALIPPPRIHRHRYHGVLAPNSPHRAQVTPLGWEAMLPSGPTLAAQASAAGPPQRPARSPVRILWAVLMACLYEIFPLRCPHCGAEMRIIAFITEPPLVKAILAHLGEPPRSGTALHGNSMRKTKEKSTAVKAAE